MPFLLGFLMAFAFLFFPLGCKQSKPETRAPVISRSFAIERGPYGHIWKIYIEAEDPDADMERIAVIVSRVGCAQSPTDWIILKPEHRAHFVGYLQWNTFSSKTAYLPEWTQLRVNVSVFDKSGNESNEVVFPFTFESGARDEIEDQLPAPFDTGNVPRLGHIMIDLFDSK